MSDGYVTVRWWVEDGYINNGPHKTKISTEDLAYCESDGDMEMLIDEVVRADFENTISFDFHMSEAMANAKKAIDEFNREALTK